MMGKYRVRLLLTFIFTLIALFFIPKESWLFEEKGQWFFLNYYFITIMLFFICACYLTIVGLIRTSLMLIELPWTWKRRFKSKESVYGICYLFLFLLLLRIKLTFLCILFILIGLREGWIWVKKQQTSTWL